MGRVKYLTSWKLEAGYELESCKLEAGLASWKLLGAGELEYTGELRAGKSNT